MDQFCALLELIAERYATMVYVAVFTAPRVNELAGMLWSNVHADSMSRSRMRRMRWSFSLSGPGLRLNWQVLRRSCATWLDPAQVKVKDAQG